MNIIIGGAWPYANGSLHIGHIAALLPGDILARYFRQRGDDVCYVSGSDCHGTPISIRANKENTTPERIAEKYHEEFSYCFKKLGFSYDNYSSTLKASHEDFVDKFIIKLNDNGVLYEKEILQAYCEKCNKFLPDRYVAGKCPVCGSDARGDQCDSCGTLLDPEKLVDAECSVCGSKPEFRKTKHLFLNLKKFENTISEYVNSHNEWRENAKNLSKRYINEGLQDRAITRDLDWGINVPLKGYESKKIYVWVEAVLGYLSACKEWCDNAGVDFYGFWNNSIQYYVHGKDNIPFHTIILPALLLGHGNLHLPDKIISSEYVTLEGRKISTSKNYAVWIDYLISNYSPDSIRYFFTINGPEKRDTDFSWREFVNSHNGELLGAYGNFVNRTLAFVNKYYNSVIPEGKLEGEIKSKISILYDNAGIYIENGSFKEALTDIFEFIRYSNKYFDTEKPWETRNTDKEKCGNTIFNCVQIIANLCIMLNPFLPFSSEKVKAWLGINNNGWGFYNIDAGTVISDVEILFDRIDKKAIEEETKKII